MKSPILFEPEPFGNFRKDQPEGTYSVRRRDETTEFDAKIHLL